MPDLIVDLVTVVTMLALLAVAFTAPRASVELGVGLAGAALVVVVGAQSLPEAWEQVRLLFPVVAFLAAILVVAELCAVEGLFSAVGSVVARTSRGSATRMLLLTFAAAALTTAVLSLDATVVLLTPVVAAAAAGARLSGRPPVYACARLANSASLLLPVSNLTNLLALSSLPSLTFLDFAAVMAPVWVAVIAVEYAGMRLFFGSDLVTSPHRSAPVETVPLPIFSVVVVATMLVGFAALSPLGVQPAWVAAAAALVLGGYSVSRGRSRVGGVVASAQLPFAVFVLCLGVVVAGLADGFLAEAVRHLLPHRTGLLGLVVVALVATLSANVVNNLPATLLLLPLVTPLGVVAVLAALIGLGAGASLTYTGSLANLLWRRTVTRYGGTVDAGEFHRLSALVTLPAVLVGVVVLWAWAPHLV